MKLKGLYTNWGHTNLHSQHQNTIGSLDLTCTPHIWHIDHNIGPQFWQNRKLPIAKQSIEFCQAFLSSFHFTWILTEMISPRMFIVYPALNSHILSAGLIHFLSFDWMNNLSLMQGWRNRRGKASRGGGGTCPPPLLVDQLNLSQPKAQRNAFKFGSTKYEFE